jgi:hypothetical protein
VEPGCTKTDLTGHTGAQKAEQGAEIMVCTARLGPDGPTGGYIDAEGTRPGRPPAEASRPVSHRCVSGPPRWLGGLREFRAVPDRPRA